jgi:hypothetical protein
MRYKFRPTIGIRMVLLIPAVVEVPLRTDLDASGMAESDSNIKAGSDIFDGPA